MNIRRTFFISLFIGVHVLFVFIYLHKQERMIACSYEHQKKELLLEQLKKEKARLTLALEESKSQGAIKKYAEHELGMIPMKLSDTRKLERHV